jgi:hypothetical protein
MNLKDMLPLANKYGVSASSSSQDIQRLMAMPGAGFFASMKGIDLPSIQSFIDKNFKGKEQEAIAFMSGASTTALGNRDLADLIATGDADKLAELWKREPDHKSFFAQHPVVDSSNVKIASNVSPAPPNPNAANAPVPATSSPLAVLPGTSLTALAGNFLSAAMQNPAMFMNSLPGLLNAYAKFDPSFSMAKSFLNETLTMLQNSDFFGAGKGNLPHYAKMTAENTGPMAMVRATVPGVSAAKPGPT